MGNDLIKKLDTDLERVHLMLLAAKVKYAAPSHFVKVITGYDLMQAVLLRLAGFGGNIGLNHDTQLDEISNEP